MPGEKEVNKKGFRREGEERSCIDFFLREKNNSFHFMHYIKY